MECRRGLSDSGRERPRIYRYTVGAGVLQLANGAARERQPDRRRIIAPLLRTFAFTFPFRAAASPNRGTILPILDIRSGTHASCRGGPAAVTGDVDLAARAR